ncbi:hypothetical protein Tco_0790525 [Tanacetum coccineum]
MENFKKGNLPLHHGIKISKDLCPKTDKELDRMSRVPYDSAVGSIMYAMTCTSPDVSFALSMVSRHQQNPGEGQWTTIKNILKYLRNTKDRGAVTWKSSKQDTMADFTCESEYIVACEASKEAIWMKNFIGDLVVVPTIQDHIEIFYVAMLDELGLGDGRLLVGHFKIPCICFDDGLVLLMADEDVVKLLECVPRFRKVDAYVEEDVSVVEQHMIEVRFRNEHSKGLVIEEIVQEVGLNEDAKEDLFPYIYAKRMKQETERRISDQFALRDLLAKTNFEFGNKYTKMKEKLNDMDMPWGMVAPDTDDDASISGLEADEVELELEDEQMKLSWNLKMRIFAHLDEAYKEDVDSHLDEALVLEEVVDSGMFDNSINKPNEVELEVKDEVAVADIFVEIFFDNICAQMVYREIGEREVDDQLFLGDPLDNEITKHDAIENSCSNVPIGRPRKRKRVKYDETDSGYAPTGYPMKRIKLNKDERYATDFVDDVEE